MMDVVRVPRRNPGLRYVAPLAAGLALAAGTAWSVPALFHHSAAWPRVERSSLVIDVVRRGTFVRTVRAAGTLVPDRVRVVATTTGGLIDELPVRAGSSVDAGTVVAVLRDPDLEAAVVDAEAQVQAAAADLNSAREEAAAARLDRDGAYRSALADAQSAAAASQSYASLHRQGLIGDLPFREALIKSDEDAGLVGIAKRKIAVDAAGEAAKVAAAQARVEQVTAQLGARRAQAATLVVRAGSAGIVQSLAAERGERVAMGTELARIAEARDLKAVLQVAESDLHGIAPGMTVTLDASGAGTLMGRVARIAPTAQNGSVPVDVSLAGAPTGVRPDQNVDGTIELSRTGSSALSLSRPANASDDSTVELYRLSPDGTRAVRAAVHLGNGSLDRVRVLGGAAAGDRVIISDTSSYDNAPELRIEE